MRFAARHLSGLTVSILVVVHAVAEVEPEFQKGITFTHGYRGGNNMRSGASAGSLRQRLSVEWIAVNPFGYQTSVHTIGIRFGGDPRDEHLIDGIHQAQQLGLKVMLEPHIWRSEKDGSDWRGTIGFDTEREWKEWFSNYERFLLHYAQIAAQTEAEILCVGVELSRTVTDRPDDWRRLISKVREIYPGPLTYAANWWGDYDVVEFWDELDYIGINAFFPLNFGGGDDRSRHAVGGGSGRCGPDRDRPQANGQTRVADQSGFSFGPRGPPSSPGSGPDAMIAPSISICRSGPTKRFCKASGIGTGSTASTGGSGTQI